MPKGGKDIRLRTNGRYRVRVYRFGKRASLGVYSTYEEADQARDEYLNSIYSDPASILSDISPEPYTPLWYELQSRKQRIDFANRYKQ